MIEASHPSCLIEVKGLTKTFDGVSVLRNVDFSLKSGEIHALIGENGAGKSTFVKMISGVYEPSAGTIFMDGSAVTFTSVRDSEAHGIKTIHQEINLVPYFNAYENIFIGNERTNRLGITDDVGMKREAERILAMLNVSLDVTKPVSEFNASLQRVVQICSALVSLPRVLIFDEPTTSLGERERANLLDIVKRLKLEGVGIIYISHNIEEITEISDRVTIFKDGEKVSTLEKNEINAKSIISMMIGGKDYEVFQRSGNTLSNTITLCLENLTTSKLKQVSLCLHEGEILGVAGVMGAGKSEIANALFGIESIQGGRITYKGKPYLPTPSGAVKAGVGLVPEERRLHGLISNFGLQQNVTLTYLKKYAGRIFLSHSKERAVASKRIEELKIRTTGPNQIVRYLSGGNQQKVVISKWLSGDFDVLIMDEPTKGIDVMSKRDIYKLIHELSLQGKSILFMSSYLPELINFCDRIIVLFNGEVVNEFFDSDETNKEAITHSMLGGQA